MFMTRCSLTRYCLSSIRRHSVTAKQIRFCGHGDSLLGIIATGRSMGALGRKSTMGSSDGASVRESMCRVRMVLLIAGELVEGGLDSVTNIQILIRIHNSESILHPHISQIDHAVMHPSTCLVVLPCKVDDHPDRRNPHGRRPMRHQPQNGSQNSMSFHDALFVVLTSRRNIDQHIECLFRKNEKDWVI